MFLRKIPCSHYILAAILLVVPGLLQAQKVGFIASQVIKDNFLEAKQAEQRIQTIVEEWKREMEMKQKEIDALEFEIQKNRLVWSDQEKLEKQKELEDKRQQRLGFAKAKFEGNGEYDRIVKSIMTPVETKIYAAIQEVASDEGYDIIWDQSTQPMPYLNFKYDLTVKVLKKLGVNTSELEKDLQEKIDKDPRNKKTEGFKPRRKSRVKGADEDKEIERDNENQQPDGKTTPKQPGDMNQTRPGPFPKGPQNNPFKLDSNKLKQDSIPPLR